MDKTQFNPQDPNALFSPDQWTNQFSLYNNRALPWPSSFYTGTPAGSMPPTDATGKPIQSFLDMQAKHDAWRPPASSASASSAPMGTDPNFGLENQWLAANNQPVQLAPTRTPGQLGPQTQAALDAMNAASGAAGATAAQGAQPVPGTTLNSMPQSQPQPAGQGAGSGQPGQGQPQNTGWNQNPAGSPLNPTGDWSGLAPNLGLGPQAQANYAYDLGLPGTANDPSTGMAFMGGGQAQKPAAAAPANPFDMHQAYLDALANPGKVNTPGATVPAGPSTQPGPGALQAFLASWKPSQAGPGSGFQQGFGGTLKNLGY